MLDSKSSCRLSVLSLLSGCGGLDSGFASEGFEILAALDSDPSAIETYNANHSPVGQLSVIGQGSVGAFRPDVIIAGPPCQGFSTGGGYQLNDPRNALLPRTCEIIAQLQPKIAVVENVAALTNARNKETLELALRTLEKAGYYFELEILFAPDFGVAQNRRRTVITARSDQRPFARMEHSSSKKVSIECALHGIDEKALNHQPTYPEIGSQHYLIAKQIGPAQKLCNVRSGPNSVPTWDIPACFGETSESERVILETIRTLRRRNRKRDFGDADPVTIQEIWDADIDCREQQIASLVARGFLRILPNGIDLRVLLTASTDD